MDYHYRRTDKELQAKTEQFIRTANDDQFQIFLPSFSFVWVLLAVGLPANILSLVIFKRKLKKAIARNFLITMCVCDSISCAMIMPVELDIMRHFFEYESQWLCKSFRFLAFTVTNVSSLTLLAIALERYRIIVIPWKTKFNTQLALRICGVNVVIATLTALPMAVVYGTQTIPLGLLFEGSGKDVGVSVNCSNNHRTCNSSFHKQEGENRIVYGKSCLVDDNMIGSSFPIYVVAVYLAVIVIIFIVLIYLYGRVITKLARRRSESMCQQNNKNQVTLNKRVRHVTLMAIILTFAYEVCYLPCLTIVCLRLAQPSYYYSLSTSGKMVYNFLLKSYLLNSAINPYIYCFCNSEFRAGLFMLLRSLKITMLPSRHDSIDVTNTKNFSETAFRKI